MFPNHFWKHYIPKCHLHFWAAFYNSKNKKRAPQNPSPSIFTKPIKKQFFQIAKFHSILPFGDVTKFSEFSLQVQSKGSQGLLCQCPSKCQVASQILTSNFAHVKLASFNMASFSDLIHGMSPCNPLNFELGNLLSLPVEGQGAICWLSTSILCLWNANLHTFNTQPYMMLSLLLEINVQPYGHSTTIVFCEKYVVLTFSQPITSWPPHLVCPPHCHGLQPMVTRNHITSQHPQT